MSTLAGYKTAIYKGLKILGAALVTAGAMPAEATQLIIDNIEAVIAAWLIIDGIIGGVIRHFTTTLPFWRKQ